MSESKYLPLVNKAADIACEPLKIWAERGFVSGFWSGNGSEDKLPAVPSSGVLRGLNYPIGHDIEEAKARIAFTEKLLAEVILRQNDYIKQRYRWAMMGLMAWFFSSLGLLATLVLFIRNGVSPAYCMVFIPIVAAYLVIGLHIDRGAKAVQGRIRALVPAEDYIPWMGKPGVVEDAT